MNYRLCAVKTLIEVISKGHSLNRALASYENVVAAQQLPLYRQMVYGVLRFYPALELLLTAMLDKPLPPKHQDVAVVIILGLYEIRFLKSPDHASVNESVNNVVSLKKPWARGLVNAVLRRATRELPDLEEELAGNEVYYYSHPAWLIDVLKQAWPEDFEQILENNNIPAPMTLRVNQKHMGRNAYLSQLSQQGFSAACCAHASHGVRLETSTDVYSLPGFVRGLVSVQDEASQLVVDLLDLKPGLQVLDSCAAPGGKSCHMLESCENLKLTALDQDAQRLLHLDENLQRLNLSCDSTCGNALNPADWWTGQPFDRILLDAPCSATGIIRRHPDIKLLRKPSDIDKLAQQQLGLLKALWPLLRKGGLLLYTTCSVLPQENNRLVQQFLSVAPDAREHPIDADWGSKASIGRQLLPIKDGPDGFYYALLHKN